MTASRGSSVRLVLGISALGLGLWAMLAHTRKPVHRMTLTAGPFGTTRSLVASQIVDTLKARGIDAELLETPRTQYELDRVNAGTIDFALVSEAFRIGPRPHVREVTPLYLEALHLLVKEDLVDAVSRDLGALRGHGIGIARSHDASTALSTDIFAFAGVPAADETRSDGYLPHHLELHEMERLVAQGDRAAMPDAFVYLATVPSKVGMDLIHTAGYRLVALPFAEAFRLNALLLHDDADEIDHERVSDTVIPAFTYQAQPGVPAESLHTIGSRLTLIANDRVPNETVARVLEIVFDSPIARVTHPPIDSGVLTLPAHAERHPGTIAFMQRDKPYITNDLVGTLSGVLSVVGALVGGVLFLWQWWRQRVQAVRDETLKAYLLRIADVERRMAALELGTTLHLEPLASLQREVLQVKSEALDRFLSGDLGSQVALADLLMPLNAVRDHVGDLMLHVRESTGEQLAAPSESMTSS